MTLDVRFFCVARRSMAGVAEVEAAEVEEDMEEEVGGIMTTLRPPTVI